MVIFSWMIYPGSTAQRSFVPDLDIVSSSSSPALKKHRPPVGFGGLGQIRTPLSVCSGALLLLPAQQRPGERAGSASPG